MTGRPVLCAVCRREVPLRKDGRLRGHLAKRGTRGACEGSGQFSARVVLQGSAGVRLEVDPGTQGWDHMTKAQRFNAQEEWAKVYALLDELNDMREVGAASIGAVNLQIRAFNRALDDAKALAPWGVVRGMWGEGEAA
jgi:hypothetical protein